MMRANELIGGGGISKRICPICIAYSSIIWNEKRDGWSLREKSRSSNSFVSREIRCCPTTQVRYYGRSSNTIVILGKEW